MGVTETAPRTTAGLEFFALANAVLEIAR
jgi:hypothetical protein